MNRLRDRHASEKPRIYSTRATGGCGFWIDRVSYRGGRRLEVEYAGTFDEAVGIVNQWLGESK